MGIFKKRQYGIVTMPLDEKNVPVVPDGTWVKCDKCGKILYKKYLIDNLNICSNCNHYFRLGAFDRIKIICDKDSFKEFDSEIKTEIGLDFPNYKDKLEKSMKNSNLVEGVITGEGRINGIRSIIAVMDSNFMMGSMGTVVGEKITRAVERAIDIKLPLIIFTASGGARMQEGILSLMQMAKVSSAIARLNEAGQLYVTVLTDPTTGGVTASFAMLGDVIISEPGALIGFAGKRVIEGTIKQSLPDNFQSAEFLLKSGFIDKIVKRKDLKTTLGKILMLHGYR